MNAYDNFINNFSLKFEINNILFENDNKYEYIVFYIYLSYIFKFYQKKKYLYTLNLIKLKILIILKNIQF